MRDMQSIARSIQKRFLHVHEVDIKCVRGERFFFPDRIAMNREVAEVVMGILNRNALSLIKPHLTYPRYLIKQLHRG